MLVRTRDQIAAAIDGNPLPVPNGYPRYGNTVVGPPGSTTWLRIVRRMVGGEEYYGAYTSVDGVKWVRGGVWTHNLGVGAKIVPLKALADVRIEEAPPAIYREDGRDVALVLGKRSDGDQ